MIGILLIILYACLVILAAFSPHLVHVLRAPKERAQIHRVNYWQIARTEIEIWGHTFPNENSPIEEGCTSLAGIYGVDDTGHLKDGQCNLNAQLGRACTIHNPHDGAVSSPMPTFPGDPLWTDEDGRPW